MATAGARASVSSARYQQQQQQGVQTQPEQVEMERKLAEWFELHPPLSASLHKPRINTSTSSRRLDPR